MKGRKFFYLAMILFIFALILGSFSGQAMSATDSFDSYNTGNLVGNGDWVQLYSYNSLTVSNSSSYSGSKSVYVHRGSVTQGATYDDSNTDPSRNVISFYFNTTNAVTGVNSPSAVFTARYHYSGGWYTGEWTTHFGLYPTSSSAYDFRIDNSSPNLNSSYTVVASGLSENTWYKGEVEFDVTGNSFRARINGGSWSSSQSLGYNILYIKKVHLETGNSSESYIDDFRLGTLTSLLSVSRQPEAGGGVASLDQEETIQCGVNQNNYCQAYINPNTEMELMAYESEGYAFSHWEWNEGSSSSTNNPETFLVDDGLGVKAVFNLDLKMPLPGGKSWMLNVETGGETDCSIQGPDYAHTSNGYFSLDFNDLSQENGQETDVPVLAAATGEVVISGWDDDFGWTVVLDHGGGYRTRYAHMKNNPNVSGTKNQGDQLGIIGTTGQSTGTHLHFQVYYNGSSNANIPELGTVIMEGQGLEDYAVGCPTYYESTNTQ